MASIKDGLRGLISPEELALLVKASETTSILSFTNASRPDASTLDAGTQIWNTDANAPEFSDGVNWRDADGNIT